jgi:hypothetical protein
VGMNLKAVFEKVRNLFGGRPGLPPDAAQVVSRFIFPAALRAAMEGMHVPRRIAFPTGEQLREVYAREAAGRAEAYRTRCASFRCASVAARRGRSRAVRRGRVVRTAARRSGRRTSDGEIPDPPASRRRLLARPSGPFSKEGKDGLARLRDRHDAGAIVASCSRGVLP